MPALYTQEGTPVFRITKKLSSEYSKKDHGRLFAALKPVSDPSRSLRVKKGEVVAGPEAFFFKYGNLFDQVSSPPVPKRTAASDIPVEQNIFVVVASENWSDLEKEAVSRKKLEFMSARTDLYSLVKTNAELMKQLNELKQRFDVIETSMQGDTQQKRGRPKTSN